MNIAVVNIFDPLPSEPLREGRYAALCRALAAAGHAVHWYSTDFSHALKRPRDAAAIAAAARDAGYAVTLVPARPYAGNVSPARLLSHRQTAGAAGGPVVGGSRAARRDRGEPSAAGRGQGGRRLGRADRFAAGRRYPGPLARDVQAVLAPRLRLDESGRVRRHDPRCPGCVSARPRPIIGVARGYTEYGLAYAAPGTPAATLYLGVDLAAFDAAVKPLAEIGLTKPPGERWLFIAGSFSHYVDVDAALDLMDELRRRGRTDVRMHAMGAGRRNRTCAARPPAAAWTNITFHGRQADSVFMSVEAASDVALLPLKPGGQVFFPNRVFDFLAAGLPVVSTVRGELADVLARHGAGVTCPSSDARVLADAVERLLSASPAVAGEGMRRRPPWVEPFDRRAIAARMAKVIESAASRRPLSGATP